MTTIKDIPIAVVRRSPLEIRPLRVFTEDARLLTASVSTSTADRTCFGALGGVTSVTKRRLSAVSFFLIL
jgi:hypothetical protein